MKKTRCKLCGHFPPGAPRKSQRDQEIRKSNLSPGQIAKRFGISKQRVYQIKGAK